MGFNLPPVPPRDSDWEIRAAVLLSLLFQVLLIFVGPIRKRTSNPVSRFVSWSCYLLADWVADLALGLLVNNLGNIGGGSSSSTSAMSFSSAGGKLGVATNSTTTGAGSGSSPGIFAFWTPFLLLHLGGPDTITAYSVEDNQLWRRHLIGLLFQLFAACVVFSCSIDENPMIPGTVLMFVAGIIKYGERTYSLYSSSVDGILSSILPAPDPGPNYARLMAVFSSKEKAGLDVEIVAANGVARQWKQFESRFEATQLARDRDGGKKTLEEQAYNLFTIFRSVCYDINLGHREREISQAFFFLDPDRMTASNAVEVIEVELNFMYDMVHTKQPVAHTLAGCILRFVSSCCIAYSVVSFFRLDKQKLKLQGGSSSIRRVDVDITYALLLGALALDVAALFMLIFCSDWTLVFLDKSTTSGGHHHQQQLLKRLGSLIRSLRPKLRPRWSQKTPQLNLIGCCLGKLDGDEASATFAGRHLWRSPQAIRALGKVAHKLRAAEIFDDIFFVRREPLTLRTRGGGSTGTSTAAEDGSMMEFVLTELWKAAEQVRRSTVSAGDQVWGSKAAAEAFRKARHKEVEEMKKACSYRGERALFLSAVKKRITGRDGESRKLQMRAKEKGEDQETINMQILQEEEEDDDIGEWDILMDSVIDRDFDESLLMWHIATDLCLLSVSDSQQPSSSSSSGSNKKNKWMSISKTLSEYLLYLLVKRPKVLASSAGVGQVAYQDTCAEARRFFESAATWDPDHEDARRMLLHTSTSVKPELVKGGRSKSVLFPATIIAKELMKLNRSNNRQQQEDMWELVAGVWVEMLTYAAAKCKGTTHVHQLARGGELITIVWLLMAHMGIGNIYRKTVEEDATPKLIIHNK